MNSEQAAAALQLQMQMQMQQLAGAIQLQKQQQQQQQQIQALQAQQQQQQLLQQIQGQMAQQQQQQQQLMQQQFSNGGAASQQFLQGQSDSSYSSGGANTALHQNGAPNGSRQPDAFGQGWYGAPDVWGGGQANGSDAPQEHVWDDDQEDDDEAMQQHEAAAVLSNEWGAPGEGGERAPPAATPTQGISSAQPARRHVQKLKKQASAILYSAADRCLELPTGAELKALLAQCVATEKTPEGKEAMTEEWLAHHWPRVVSMVERDAATLRQKRQLFAASKYAAKKAAEEREQMEGAEGGANAEGSVDADDDIGDQARALIQAAVRGESVTLPEDSELKRRILDLLPQHMSHVSEPPRTWNQDDKVEACDSQGAWYRSTVVGTSLTGGQVKVNFAGWPSKWDEWLDCSGNRIRDIQHPEVSRIRKDGTPIWPKKKEEKAMVVEEGGMEEDDGGGMEEVPVMSREEQRAVERIRQREAAEEAARKKAAKKNGEGKDKATVVLSQYQAFLKDEIARIKLEQPGIVLDKARKIAKERWQAHPSNPDALCNSRMGVVFGSVHQMYLCNDEETILMVAERLVVDAKKMMQMNKQVYPGLKEDVKLMEGTILKLPNRIGSGDKTEIKFFCKLAAWGNKTVTVKLRACDKIAAIKRRISDLEGIPPKDQTLIYAMRRLDDGMTLSDYNIKNECQVFVQMGSKITKGSEGPEETEYDSNWMAGGAGRAFLETETGMSWIKTPAGKAWQKELKQKEKEEKREAKERELREKREARGDSKAHAGDALSAYREYIKDEVTKLQAANPRLDTKEATARARSIWKVSSGCKEHHVHRLTWAAIPSVVSWSSQNCFRASVVSDDGEEAKSKAPGGKGEAGEKETGSASAAAAAAAAAADAATAAAIAAESEFNCSYDWGYRSKNLSRTAKKAAKISLTTDTLEMMTCELSGFDDRYDGSGWTLHAKKVKGKKRGGGDGEDGGDAKKAKKAAAKEKRLTEDPPAPPADGGKAPAWFKRVATCPPLILPPVEGEEEIGGDASTATTGEDASTAATGGDAQQPAAAVIAPVGDAKVQKEGGAENGVPATAETTGTDRNGQGCEAMALDDGEMGLKGEISVPSMQAGGSKVEGDTLIVDSKNAGDQGAAVNGVTKSLANGVVAHGEGEAVAVSGDAVMEDALPTANGDANGDIKLDAVMEDALPTANGDAKLDAMKGDATPAVNGDAHGDANGDSKVDAVEGDATPAANGDANGDAKADAVEGDALPAANGDANGDAKADAVEGDALPDGQRVKGMLPPPPKAPAEVTSADCEPFRLPYAAARALEQERWEDEVCNDNMSEFPTPFVPLTKNLYIGEALEDLQALQKKLADYAEATVCHCLFVPGIKETACGERADCMLRDLFVECNPRTCPCGKHCLNQRLQKKQWAKCSIFRASDGRGWCLQNDEDLQPGQLVLEYVGEVVSGLEARRRMAYYAEKRHTYMLKLNTDDYIDSSRKGNLSRFINHCCEPNTMMQKWTVGNVKRVALFAKYFVPAGSELTFDYDMEFDFGENVKCLCGAPRCRGTLGKPKDGEEFTLVTHGTSMTVAANQWRRRGQPEPERVLFGNAEGDKRAAPLAKPTPKGKNAVKDEGEGGEKSGGGSEGGGGKGKKEEENVFVETVHVPCVGEKGKGKGKDKSKHEAGGKEKREEGGKRKREEVKVEEKKEEEVDEAFAGLSERERKKQMAMLKQLEAMQGKHR